MLLGFSMFQTLGELPCVTSLTKVFFSTLLSVYEFSRKTIPMTNYKLLYDMFPKCLGTQVA